MRACLAHSCCCCASALEQQPAVRAREGGELHVGLADVEDRRRAVHCELPCQAPVCGSAREMEHLGERDNDGRAVRMDAHDVLHAVPPAAHHGVARQRRHRMIVAPLEIGEQRRGLLVEMDRIIRDAGFAEQGGELRPDRVVPRAILRHVARAQKHLEGVSLAHRRRRKRRRPSLGKGPAQAESEVEVLDIVLGEDERRSQQDFAAVDDVQLAELARLDRGPAGLEPLAVDDRAHDEGRGVAEIDRVVGNYNAGFGIGFQKLREVRNALFVEIVCRFIEEKDIGILDDGLSEKQSRLLAA